LGSDRWLVVGRSVDQIYPIVRDFWKESGFTLTQENQVLGLLETEWAENRAKLPQDLLRRTLGKVVDGLYSTGERDKYRTQLEPLTTQSTEIRISHRGMVEVFAGVMKDSLIWQPRPSDPGLENEFLRRLMLKLGAPAQQADQAVALANVPSTAAKAENIAGQTSIFLNEGFDIAWRRVGLALDRTGFTVEDRDRRNGTYFVRFVETPNDKEGNVFTRMFKAKKVPVPVKYRIAITAQANGGSRAVVLSIDGQNEASPTSQKIAKLLLDELK
jgi:outer membrane protein assembly factor BamC